MTDNIAVLDGYTKEISGEYKGQSFFLLVQPDAQLDGSFRAWCMDLQEYVRVNGWLAEFNEI